MENTKFKKYINRYFQGDIRVFAFYSYIVAIPFSHAPSVIHPLITFPGLLSIFLILLFAIQRKKKVEHLFVLSLPLVAASLSIVLNINYFIPSSANHLVAYFWFFTLGIALIGLLDKTKVNIKTAFKLLLITTLISSFYAFAESILHTIFIDIGSYIPRYDRQEYQFWTPFFFFRTRAFNFESANLALLFNTAYPLLYYYYKNHRLKILGIWSLSLLLTFSVFHFVVFAIFGVCLLFRKYYYLTRNYRFNLYSGLLLTTLLIVLIINYELLALIVDHINTRLGGETISSRTRLERFFIGVEILKEHPITGVGMAGYYHFVDTGLHNFYLHVFVQMGVLGVLVLAYIGYFFYRVLLTDNFYILSSFLMGWSHLFIIGDFWLPQLFLPIIFATLLHNSQLRMTKKL